MTESRPFPYRRVCVFGAARSGTGATHLLRHHGVEVVIVDQRPCPIPYVPASTASSAANAVKDLNVLIALLKDAKLIERKAPTLALSVAETEVEAVVGSEATLAIDARASDGRALS